MYAIFSNLDIILDIIHTCIFLKYILKDKLRMFSQLGQHAPLTVG